MKRSGRYDGEFLPGPQLDNLAQRLQTLSKDVPIREKKLEFDETQHRILDMREPTEARLQQWTAKLGSQKEVQQMLNDYQVGRLLLTISLEQLCSTDLRTIDPYIIHASGVLKFGVHVL